VELNILNIRKPIINASFAQRAAVFDVSGVCCVNLLESRAGAIA
jgi:hypothetical protein